MTHVLNTAQAPKVSIVLPTHDRLDFLREAVTSVLRQTVVDWELIVVDDGSTDGTVAWLESLGDPRIVVVAEPHCGNPAALRNLGVANAQSPWIALLDSDDLWAPDKLELQLDRLVQNPARRWSCTGVSFIDDHGSPIPQQGGKPYRAQSGWILEPLLTFSAAATTPTLMIHRSLFDEAGGFDERVLLREDYDLELRLAARSEIHALPESLTFIRHHSGRTSSVTRVADLYRWNATVFRKFARETVSRSLRTIGRRQCAAQLILQARALSRSGEHQSAVVASLSAIRETPFRRNVWRAAAGCVLRAFGWSNDQERRASTSAS
jgi:glycosyltransferase involved in cell wall biosynthesis